MQTCFAALYISGVNLMFAAAPVVAVAVLEQDVSAADAIKYPFLYAAGPKNMLFTNRHFFRSLLRGLLHAVAIYYVW